MSHSSFGFIKEIFSSIQGEGEFTGSRQLFIRLSGCSAGCSYCDTDYSSESSFEIEGRIIENPVSAQKLVELCKEFYDLKLYHSISVTGGEPLEQPEFAKDIAELFKGFGCKIFLETNGFMIEEFEKYHEKFDYLSIDIKLCEKDKLEHLGMLFYFLQNIRKKGYYLKLIFDEINSDLDFSDIASLLKKYKIEKIYFQPVDNLIDLHRIDKISVIMYKNGIDAYFRPQIHKMTGLR